MNLGASLPAVARPSSPSRAVMTSFSLSASRRSRYISAMKGSSSTMEDLEMLSDHPCLRTEHRHSALGTAKRRLVR